MSAFPRTPFISNLEPDNSLGIVCLEGGLQIERQAYPLTFDKAPIYPIVCFPMPNLNREG